MKTIISTIFAIVSLAVVTSNSAYANTNNNDKEVSTVLTNISKINKIEIHGNVELYVSDGSADQVKVYNKYYSESALVQSNDGVLRISSYSGQKLVVWVTANDLRAITAYDNSEVKSFGNLSKIELDVNLYNNAIANLNVDAYRATVTVNDNAKATLAGTVNDYCLKYTSSANINTKDFAAANSTTVLISSPEYRGTELANL
ncbi:GIN domain-containing protein [Mucilaginibacter sp.]|uniref:GIN domain-containing protein n=1 Tax=Mucilaginibacter sp. TaxID=1882438 RepID=UPI0035BBFA12